MAMTPTDRSDGRVPDAEPDAAPETELGTELGSDLLESAAAGLRDRVDPRWVEISDRVLAKVLTATRRSLPIQAQATSGPVHVSEQVLITHLRDAVQDHVSGTHVRAINVHLRGRDTLESVTIQVAVDYGVVILPLADQVHRLASERLDAVLGPAAPPVQVRVTHVHVSDVVGDPGRG